MKVSGGSANYLNDSLVHHERHVNTRVQVVVRSIPPLAFSCC